MFRLLRYFSLTSLVSIVVVVDVRKMYGWIFCGDINASGFDTGAMKTGDIACDIACDMVFAATLPEFVQFVHPHIAETHSIQHWTLMGRTPPLGRSPPRTIFLI